MEKGSTGRIAFEHLHVVKRSLRTKASIERLTWTKPYWNTNVLTKNASFLTPTASLLLNGDLTTAVKRARIIALLPFVSSE